MSEPISGERLSGTLTLPSQVGKYPFGHGP